MFWSCIQSFMVWLIKQIVIIGIIKHFESKFNIISQAQKIFLHQYFGNYVSKTIFFQCLSAPAVSQILEKLSH